MWLRKPILFLALSFCGLHPLSGQNANWTNASSSNALWQTASNWNPSGAPSGFANFSLGSVSYEIWINSATMSASPTVSNLQYFGSQDVTLRGTEFAVQPQFAVGNSIFGAGDNMLIYGVDMTVGSSIGGFGSLTIDGATTAGTSVTTNALFGGVGNPVRIVNGAQVQCISGNVSELEILSGASFESADFETTFATLAGPGSSWTSPLNSLLSSEFGQIDVEDGATANWANALVRRFNVSDSASVEISDLLTLQQADAQITSDATLTVFQLTMGSNGILDVDSNAALNVTDFMIVNAAELNESTINLAGGSTSSVANLRLRGYVTCYLSGSGTLLHVTESAALADSSLIEISADGRLTLNETSIDQTSSIIVDDGRLDFGLSDYSSFERIQYSPLSHLIGDVLITEPVDIALLPALESIEVGFANMEVINSSVMTGTGIVDAAITVEAEGEIRVPIVDTFQTTSALVNEGEVNIFGGVLECEEMYQYGFLFGHGVLISSFYDNQETAAFSGPTDILGDFCNNGGLVISTGTGTTTFFDDFFAEPGSEVRTSGNSATVFFGGFEGTGSFTGTGDVYFEGDLQPGHSPGQIQFEGNVSLGSTVVTHIEIGGDASGEFDQLLVSGDFNAGGVLSILIAEGFQLQSGMEFPIVTVDGTAIGQFTGLDEGDTVVSIDGIDLQISYVGGDGNDIVLSAFGKSILYGDLNLDGMVDLSDIPLFVNRLVDNTYQIEADINGDGVVSLTDIPLFVDILANN